MKQESIAQLDKLIQFQAGWIRSLQANQEQLEKYRNGILPMNEKRIADIASAQQGLAQCESDRSCRKPTVIWKSAPWWRGQQHPRPTRRACALKTGAVLVP